MSPGNYAFFVDFVGSDRDENTIGAVEEVKTITTTFKLVGCYKERTVS
jgi:prephenate dehydratase